MTASRASSVAVAGALLLTGCTTPAGVERPPGPEPPVSGELRQFRGNAATRLLQVTLRVRAPVEVTRARVELGGFAPGPDNRVDARLPAGAVTDLPVRYGAADCDARADAATARAMLTLRAEGGEREIVVPLADRGLVERLHAVECTERALAEQVRFTLDADAAPVRVAGRPALPVVLRLQRLRDGDRVVVQELGAHIVFTVRPGVAREPLLELGPDETSAELPLTLIPTRCDGHALAENKRAGLLGVYVALGEAEARLTTVVPDDATQARLRDFTVAGCRDS